MGHRKSHSRVSKRGKTEAHDEDKDHKRERKRKREHKEGASRKRHKEQEKGKNIHHRRTKSLAKKKTKGRVFRQKSHASTETSSSESESSASSSKSSKRHGHHHRHGDRNHNPEEETKKRLRKGDESICMNDKRHSYDAKSEPLHCSLEPLGSEVKESHVSRLDDGRVARPQEQEMGINGKEENFLEVELRQRALANLMRYRDTSLPKVPEPKEKRLTSSSPLVLVPKKNGGSVTTLDSHVSDVGARTDDEHRPALITDRKDLSLLGIEGRTLVRVCDDALEEGEIGQHMVDAISLPSEDYVSVGKKGYELMLSGRLEQEGTATPQAELEGAPVAEDSTLATDDKHQKDASGVGPLTSGQESKAGFQKKTMSVMRGGEMVQVSYNVYIPKRAAELARRRLQR